MNIQTVFLFSPADCACHYSCLIEFLEHAHIPKFLCDINLKIDFLDFMTSVLLIITSL